MDWNEKYIIDRTLIKTEFKSDKKYMNKILYIELNWI